jgi:phage terminase small subunit
MDQFTELTPKQALFCAEYFVDFNATKAALRAGYSPATALSGKLMMIPKIKQHLQQRGAKLHEDMEVNNQAVLDELKKIAFASMGDYFDADGKIKPMHLVSEDAKPALSNYTFTEDKNGNTTIKIRTANKLTALEKIARLLNFYGGPPQEVTYWIWDTAAANAEDRLDDTGLEQGVRSKEQEQVEEVCSEEGTRNKDQGQDREADIERRIAEAVAETELRMRAEFALMDEGTRSKEQGQGMDKREETGIGNESTEVEVPKEGLGTEREGGMVAVKNADFYHPVKNEECHAEVLEARHQGRE